MNIVFKTIVDATTAIVGDVRDRILRARCCSWKDQRIDELRRERDELIIEIRRLNGLE